MKQDGVTLSMLKQLEKLGIPSIDCVVYHKGSCVFRYQSGFSDEARKQPVDGSERYNIYSCSKVIACTAVMQLVEKDVIRLDDAVYEYLPEFRDMKLGTEYESGGAGCISTVDDYIMFLENLRSGERLLHRDTVTRMTVPQISRKGEPVYDQFSNRPGYSYGLGVRCPKPGSNVLDWGWGGAAGAYLAIIPSLEITFFYAQHVLLSSSAVHQIRKNLTKAVIQDII